MPSRRRSRWTVTFAEGEARVILTYDAASARAFYARQGKTVTRVVKGDLVTKAKVAPNGAGWKLNRENLADAIELLGLKFPVKITQTHRVGPQCGRHRTVPTGGGAYVKGNKCYHLDSATSIYHDITVKSYLDAEHAGRTIWHELTHAMQVERAGGTPAEMVRGMRVAYRDGNSYRHKPLEVEARESEPMNDVCPLATPAR